MYTRNQRTSLKIYVDKLLDGSIGLRNTPSGAPTQWAIKLLISTVVGIRADRYREPETSEDFTSFQAWSERIPVILLSHRVAFIGICTDS